MPRENFGKLGKRKILKAFQCYAISFGFRSLCNGVIKGLNLGHDVVVSFCLRKLTLAEL